MTIIAGIDPGKTGAMVVLYPDNSMSIFRVPLVKSPKDTPAWAAWGSMWHFGLSNVDVAVIENVATRPGQGISSSGKFMRTFGFAHGLVASHGFIETHFVTPAVWKAKLGLLNCDKSASREKARSILPKIADEVTRVKDDGVAEAALLAYYGRKYL